MSCDYYALNKQTIKNKYPLPLAVDCFDKLARTRVFSKLLTGKEKKTTIVTRYGSFEFLVMSLGLCNALVMFCTLMKDVLCPYLDPLVVVYFDDIVIYNDNMEDQKRHLTLVFEALRKNMLFLKKLKCMFT